MQSNGEIPLIIDFGMLILLIVDHAVSDTALNE